MNNLATLGLIPSRMTRLLCNQPVRGLRELIDWSNTGKSSAANITPWIDLQDELREVSKTPAVEAEAPKAIVEAKATVEPGVAVEAIPTGNVVEEVIVEGVEAAKERLAHESPMISKEPVPPVSKSPPVVERESIAIEAEMKVTEATGAVQQLTERADETLASSSLPEPNAVSTQKPLPSVESKPVAEIPEESLKAKKESPAIGAVEPLVAQGPSSDVAQKVEVVAPVEPVALDVKPSAPKARVEEPKESKPARVVSTESKAMPPSTSVSRPPTVPQPIPPLPTARAAAPSASENEYLMQLERLVVQLNYELGMKQAQSQSEGPEQWMVQRMIELNLRNLELQDQLANALRTSQLSGAK